MNIFVSICRHAERIGRIVLAQQAKGLIYTDQLLIFYCCCFQLPKTKRGSLPHL